MTQAMAFEKEVADALASICGNLKAARDAAGMSQTKAAHAMGVSNTQISRWERDNIPKLDALIKFAKIYGTTLDHLCGLKPLMPPPLKLPTPAEQLVLNRRDDEIAEMRDQLAEVLDLVRGVAKRPKGK